MKTNKVILTSKQQRILDRCIRDLFSAKAFGDKTSLEGLEFTEILKRLVSPSEASVYKIPLSNQGIDAHERIVSTLQEANLGGDNATYSDLWGATRAVIERCFAQKLRPDDAVELKSLVETELKKQIKDRTFVAPLLGVQLSDVEEVRLGSMTIVGSVDHLINKQNFLEPSSKPVWLWTLLRKTPCIVGTYQGTFEAAKRKFTEQAHLVSGFLAVTAGYIFEHGATSFDIRVLIGSSESSEASGYLHWNAGEKFLGWGTNSGPSQPLKIDKALEKNIAEVGFINYGFHLLHKVPETDVEEAILRAVYWYGDAHRDPVPVMQFVKYWSCLECFFSIDKQDITESLAVGLTVVLTFGHFTFFQREDYAKNKASVKQLYKKRSKAVHGAVHSHVSTRDLAQLSQWTAFVIANMVSYVNADLPSRRVLAARLKQIDLKETQRV
jgi:Apea-like HEPN